MSNTSDQRDWTKPAAMAIPKGGFFPDEIEKGRYGPIFPRTPSCYGFSILGKVIPGREEVFHEYARNIEKTIAAQPGVAAAPGLTYNNSFLFYARDEQVGGNGEVLATGQQAVLLDMNTLLWASSQQMAMLGNARFSFAATIPLANNSLSSSTKGAISGGGGLGDIYLQPAILGWNAPRADIRGIVGW
jgi:hypothetical protein